MDNLDMPWRRLAHLQDDFEAVVRIYGHAEGGRQTWAYNGIRWDWAYADPEPEDTLYMIHPDFLGTDGSSWNERLPVGVEMTALFYILVDQMRQEVHRDRIRPGMRFFCHEGGRRVAEGTVTRITGLLDPRMSPKGTP